MIFESTTHASTGREGAVNHTFGMLVNVTNEGGCPIDNNPIESVTRATAIDRRKGLLAGSRIEVNCAAAFMSRLPCQGRRHRIPSWLADILTGLPTTRPRRRVPAVVCTRSRQHQDAVSAGSLHSWCVAALKPVSEWGRHQPAWSAPAPLSLRGRLLGRSLVEYCARTPRADIRPEVTATLGRWEPALGGRHATVYLCGQLR